MVWTSQNYHDVHNVPNLDVAAFNKAVFAALKPGGLFIVLDHAAAPGSGSRNVDAASNRSGDGQDRGAGRRIRLTGDRTPAERQLIRTPRRRADHGEPRQDGSVHPEVPQAAQIICGGLRLPGARHAAQIICGRTLNSKGLGPRAQIDLETPRVARLAQDVEVGLGNALRIERAVIGVRPGCRADRAVDDEMRDVNALRPELARCLAPGRAARISPSRTALTARSP